jgi:hypothetical protein
MASWQQASIVLLTAVLVMLPKQLPGAVDDDDDDDDRLLGGQNYLLLRIIATLLIIQCGKCLRDNVSVDICLIACKMGNAHGSMQVLWQLTAT